MHSLWSPNITYLFQQIPARYLGIYLFFQLEKLLNFCTASTSGALAQIHCFVVNQTLDELCIFCAQKYIVPLLLLLELEFLCVVMRQTEFARVWICIYLCAFHLSVEIEIFQSIIQRQLTSFKCIENLNNVCQLHELPSHLSPDVAKKEELILHCLGWAE